MKIAILGAGAWGTALAVALAARHRIALWLRDPAMAAELARTRCNVRYLPDAVLPDSIAPTAEFGVALADAGLVLVATPVAGLRDSLRRLKDTQAASNAALSTPVVWACKGFEAGTALLPHQLVAEELGAGRICAALSGPSFAEEVAAGKPTALTLASSDEAFARDMARELHQPVLRVYYSNDITGVEIGGAVKNVMAIATGLCDGMGLGLNARAALVTRGLAEITRLGMRLGGRAETFMGLAGAGDLILTCTGDLSRNRRVGLMLAQGLKLDAVLRQLGHVAEGVHSARETGRLAKQAGVDMPITEAVCGVLFGGMGPREAVQQLLARDPRSEA